MAHCPLAFAQPGDTLTIGYVLDSKGMWVNASKDFFTGAKTQVEEANARSGAVRRVRLVQRETDGTPQRAVQAALELVRNDKVDIIIGVAGDAALAAIATDAQLQRLGVPIVGPMSGLSLTGNPLVLFTRPDYQHETRRILQYIKGLGIHEVALVYGQSAFAGTTEAIKRGLSSSTAMRIQEYKLGTLPTERDAVLRAIASRKPPVVVVIGDSLEYAELFQAYRKLAPGALVMGMSGVNPRTILEVVPAQQMGGAVLSQVMIEPTRLTQPLTLEFDKAFKKYFDEQPSHQTLEGYVAAHVVLEAAKRSSRPITRASLQSALQSLKQVDMAGFNLDYEQDPQRGSQFVNMVMMRSDGGLMQ
jgi:branched-chain amino acid transport system substrate-binding protein